MSALQTLRNKAGLLVSVVIGFALVAFILGDFLNSSGSSSDDRIIAEVNGNKIDVDQYYAILNKLEEDYKQRSGGTLNENTRNYLRDQAWDQLVREVIMGEQFEVLGLGVESVHGVKGITPEELKDIVMGDNIDPQIQQIFANPETGAYDRNLAVNFLQNMDNDPQRKAIWLTIEKTLMQNQLAAKYNALVTKGLYVTAKEAELSATEKNQSIVFDYAGFKYSSIADSTIAVSDEDLKAYYNDNKKDFKTEALRSISYVVFPIKPSQEDYKTTEKWCANILNDFKNSEDDALFVSSNSDLPYKDELFSESTLPRLIDSSFYYEEEGAVYGPYFEQGFYKIAKLSKRVNISDSVNARHILIKSGDAQAVADSLKDLINEGADFAELAKQFSEDPGSGAKGGDLGWFTYGTMVKSFNDTCFYGETDRIYTAYSRHGIHIIEILEKSEMSEKVSVSILGAEVKASTVTVNKIYGEAGRFAGENTTKAAFEASVADNPALNKRVASDIKKNDRTLPGLKSSRSIVKWAFEAEMNSVSADVFEADDKFVVACLTSGSKEGFKSFEDVKETIRFDVIKDKKAEKLLADFNAVSATTVSDYASKLNTPINTSIDVAFNATSIPGLGTETTLIGTVAGMEAGTVSAPVKGNTGVYVASVVNVDEKSVANAASEQAIVEKTLVTKYSYAVQNTLKEESEITDNRSSFE